jgi:hypothetical protein
MQGHSSKPLKRTETHSNPNLAYAIQLVHAICCLAGSASYLDDLRADLGERGVIRAVKKNDTPALFDWLIETLSLQGISDEVALGYMAEHGSAAVIESPVPAELWARWASRQRVSDV